MMIDIIAIEPEEDGLLCPKDGPNVTPKMLCLYRLLSLKNLRAFRILLSWFSVDARINARLKHCKMLA